jgi:hypothetical protein
LQNPGRRLDVEFHPLDVAGEREVTLTRVCRFHRRDGITADFERLQAVAE